MARLAGALRRRAAGRLPALLLVLGFAVLAALAGPAGVVAQATPPARFYGTVMLDGHPAPFGTGVQALIGNAVCGSGSVSVEGGVARYTVDVPSAATRPGCGVSGAAVRFLVGGVPAAETGSFESGVFVPLNLSAWSYPPPVAPPATFYGRVTLHGYPAPDGTAIFALVGASVCGSASTTAGGYSIEVASAGMQAGCGQEGDTVRFTIADLPAWEAGVFSAGAFIPLDLTAGHAAPVYYVSVRVEPVIPTGLGDRVIGPVTVYVDAPGARRVEVFAWPVTAPFGGSRTGVPVLIGRAGHAADSYAFPWAADLPNPYVEVFAIVYGQPDVAHSRISEPVTILLDWRSPSIAPRRGIYPPPGP